MCSTGGCERRHYGRGLCKRCYHKSWTKGQHVAHPRELVPHGASLDERLRHHGWAVTKSGCWEWKRSLNGGGYGQLAVGSDRPMIASRAAYTAWIGPIPDGQVVCHRCDNPPCINPEHLFLGALCDNNADMAAKRRVANGERKTQHKLTDAQVHEIRRRYAAGNVLQLDLAAEYGVSRALISFVIGGHRRARETNPPLGLAG